jgi:hypothetical protein
MIALLLFECVRFTQLHYSGEYTTAFEANLLDEGIDRYFGISRGDSRRQMMGYEKVSVTICDAPRHDRSAAEVLDGEVRDSKLLWC